MIRTSTRLLLLFAITTLEVHAQVGVHPTGVNVNASGATVVFLTYGGLEGYSAADAFWCGELVDAFPDHGATCDPSTVFGSLPLRYDLSTPSGTGGLTDIMSIPPSVARRAYDAAKRGADSRFFYVRRFVSVVGGPDAYVAITCRLTGGGARVPFALLDVRLGFGDDSPMASVDAGEPTPPLFAEIVYNGTGQLRGRWEVVLPGEDPPSTRDLLTEATLPVEERPLQRRFTDIERFNYFLPPSGRPFRVPGPDPADLPTDAEGLYMVLLRIEATDDTEGNSSLTAAGAGEGVVHAGAVAGFPIPPLRYYVDAGDASRSLIAGKLYHVLPAEGARIAAGAPIDFSWTEMSQAVYYRLDVRSAEVENILSALLPAPLAGYRSPTWIHNEAKDGKLLWRVIAIDVEGEAITRTQWRTLFAGAAETRHP